MTFVNGTSCITYISCLFCEIVVFYSAQCTTGPPTKLMMAKHLESPLDCKEIQPVHSEGDQPWDFFGRNDAKAETPVLWPPHTKS